MGEFLLCNNTNFVRKSPLMFGAKHSFHPAYPALLFPNDMKHVLKNKPGIFGVLFDMDGVLVHSNPVHEIAIKKFCQNHKKHMSEDFLREKIYGRTNKEWIPELFEGISEEQIIAFSDEKEKLFREMFDPESAVIPGLKPLLEALQKKGIPMAVATSAPSENADFILKSLDITDFFNAILSSGDVSVGKPHPDIYQKAARRIGLKPSQCIVIEDSVAGVTSGRQAGARVIGVTSTHKATDLASCDLLIEDFRELTFRMLLDLAADSHRYKTGIPE